MEYNGGANGAWDLTQDFLDKVDADFAIARKAGVKLVIRFEYANPGEKAGHRRHPTVMPRSTGWCTTSPSSRPC